jgi:hypothetical protein
VGGGAGDVAAARGAQRAGAGGSAFQAAEPSECGSVRIGLGGDAAPAENGNPLARGVTAQALRSDFVRALYFFALVFEVAYQAPAPDAQEPDLSNA